jgi:hypothetical protein
MDNQLTGGAILTLDEDNNIKILDGKRIAPNKGASGMSTFNALPDIPQDTQEDIG